MDLTAQVKKMFKMLLFMFIALQRDVITQVI